VRNLLHVALLARSVSKLASRLLENLCSRYHLEDVGVDGRFILKFIVKKYIVGTMWLTSHGVEELRLSHALSFI
jgi:hypothetical protein